MENKQIKATEKTKIKDLCNYIGDFMTIWKFSQGGLFLE